VSDPAWRAASSGPAPGGRTAAAALAWRVDAVAGLLASGLSVDEPVLGVASHD
jgi:hypothetical protein